MGCFLGESWHQRVSEVVTILHIGLGIRKHFFGLRRNLVKAMVSPLTKHSTLPSHLVLVRVIEGSRCRNLFQVKDLVEKFLFHVLREWSALAGIRQIYKVLRQGYPGAAHTVLKRRNSRLCCIIIQLQTFCKICYHQRLLIKLLIRVFATSYRALRAKASRCCGSLL